MKQLTQFLHFRAHWSELLGLPGLVEMTPLFAQCGAKHRKSAETIHAPAEVEKSIRNVTAYD